MKLETIKNNQHGFSLVEAMIALGMLGVFSSGLYAVMSTMNSQYKLTNLRSDREFLTNQVESILSQPHSCALNFNTINLGTTQQLNVTSVKQFDDSGTAISSAVGALNTEINASSQLKVLNMKLVAPGATSGSPSLISSNGLVNTYSADFVITLKTPDNLVPLRPIIVPGIIVKTDMAGAFQSCELKATASASALCLQLGQQWDTDLGACVPTLEGACKVVGGTISGSRCITSNVVNKACATGQAIIGFGSDGEPQCSSVVSTGPSVVSTGPSTNTGGYSWKLVWQGYSDSVLPSTGTRSNCDVFAFGQEWYIQKRAPFVSGGTTVVGLNKYFAPGEMVPGYYEEYRCDNF